MPADKQPTKVKITGVIHFPEVFEAKPFKPGDLIKRFGASFAIDPKHACVKAIEDAMFAAAEFKWEKKARSTLDELIRQRKVGFMREPKRNTNGEQYDGFDGMFNLSASRNEEKGNVLVLDRQRQVITKRSEIYSGAIVNAVVVAWAQDNQWGKRLNFDLVSVQKIGDGTRLSGAVQASGDDYDDLGADESDSGMAD